ncbi:MAG TPA: pyridoxamine 5'-phosphate oxidase family protein [Alphaproteobacteria bacterium]|jgi:general stress protein 26|nr:pyridoxamine 5'-phosphate oxidase family protein [Alphaproteobacteria bacterium]
MDKRIVDFIKKNRISVLTTVLPDGTPHSAAMHFAMRDEPFEFVFFTKEVSRKCKHFKIDEKYPASLVVGFDEKEMVEFQSEGSIEKVNQTESKLGEETFATKFKGAKLDSEHIVLEYVPTWWRYTEFKPKKFVLESK